MEPIYLEYDRDLDDCQLPYKTLTGRCEAGHQHARPFSEEPAEESSPEPTIHDVMLLLNSISDRMDAVEKLATDLAVEFGPVVQQIASHPMVRMFTGGK